MKKKCSCESALEDDDSIVDCNDSFVDHHADRAIEQSIIMERRIEENSNDPSVFNRRSSAYLKNEHREQNSGKAFLVANALYPNRKSTTTPNIDSNEI